MTAPSPLLREALALFQRAPADLWPGFVPAGIPTLIFDGEQTWLGGMAPDEGGWQATRHGWRWPGRHPALVANTAVTLPGGGQAAGVLLDAATAPDAPRLAALLVHEAFHVWQARHPSPAWEANELDALSFPATDARVLHARAEETACWRSALVAGEGWRAAAREALAWRQVRSGLLRPEHRLYERRLETREGLAHFVETGFLGRFPDLDPAASVNLTAREWPYRSGAALAQLLNRGVDGWQARIMGGQPLDEVLSGRVGQPDGPPPASPTLQSAAARAARARTLHLEQLGRDFGARPGQRLRLGGGGLRVVGFDPLHTHVLPGGRVLHTRYLRVEVDGGELEVLGGQALADGADLLRPLALTVADVPEPVVSGGRWRVQTARLRADLPAATLRAGPEGWTLRREERRE